MVNSIDFNLIGRNLAEKIGDNLLGKPTVNRIILAVSSTEKKTSSGLYIPDASKEDLPKKGVVVKKGPNDEDITQGDIQVGDIIHYGMYGGKEIFPAFKEKVDGTEDLKYFVLSSSEVIYIEPNTKD